MSEPAPETGKNAGKKDGNWLASVSLGAYRRARGWVSTLLETLGRTKPASVAYRYLARELASRFVDSDRAPCIVFSTPDSLEESSEAVMTFAYYLHEELGARVLLVDGSLTRGGAGDRFGFADETGLADYLRGSVEGLDGIIRSTASPGVSVVPAGQPPEQGRLVVQAESVQALVDSLGGRFDYVLIQQGPVTLDTRYMIFAQKADLVLLYVQEGRTLVSEYEACRKIFRDYKIDNVGFIMLESGG